MHTTINPVGDDVKHLVCTSHSHLAPHPRYGINKKNAKGVWEGMRSVIIVIVSRRRQRRAVMMRTLCRQKHNNQSNIAKQQQQCNSNATTSEHEYNNTTATQQQTTQQLYKTLTCHPTQKCSSSTSSSGCQPSLRR